MSYFLLLLIIGNASFLTLVILMSCSSITNTIWISLVTNNWALVCVCHLFIFLGEMLIQFFNILLPFKMYVLWTQVLYQMFCLFSFLTVSLEQFLILIWALLNPGSQRFPPMFYLEILVLALKVCGSFQATLCVE